MEPRAPAASSGSTPRGSPPPRIGAAVDAACGLFPLVLGRQSEGEASFPRGLLGAPPAIGVHVFAGEADHRPGGIPGGRVGAIRALAPEGLAGRPAGAVDEDDARQAQVRARRLAFAQELAAVVGALQVVHEREVLAHRHLGATNPETLHPQVLRGPGVLAWRRLSEETWPRRHVHHALGRGPSRQEIGASEHGLACGDANRQAQILPTLLPEDEEIAALVQRDGRKGQGALMVAQ